MKVYTLRKRIIVGLTLLMLAVVVFSLYFWQNSFSTEGLAMTEQVKSKDGTVIAYEHSGQGQPIILVDGALCSRKFGPSAAMSQVLAPHFKVYRFDRRGRGESGNTLPYSVDREVEDLGALIKVAGGSALVLGISSGAVLGLEAASQGLPIKKLVLYEPPFIVDKSGPKTEQHWLQIDQAVAGGRPSDAGKAFLKMVGVPSLIVRIMSWLPSWATTETASTTLPYDGAILKKYQKGEPLPAGQWAAAKMPILALTGEKSPPWMHQGVKSLTDSLPNAQFLKLEGQSHDVAKAAASIGSVLKNFVEGN